MIADATGRGPEGRRIDADLGVERRGDAIRRGRAGIGPGRPS
ncbi:MAG: hypothetical protein AVDCRST_MAG19-4290 [uncultured Thermomicrobiales bacterium]|uniref:Uncharacterized protein n=1 Tax=uncultured Thermomicrobiales bacterium TaxID=1645740 RepID=A0A6J4VQM2_9BACT|nr:MAG: hypothetical protein AVDCRST_MAG19-4290 [uncultured Thermomicrobiales bacterium]